jgi:hypothetical protein
METGRMKVLLPPLLIQETIDENPYCVIWFPLQLNTTVLVPSLPFIPL